MGWAKYFEDNLEFTEERMGEIKYHVKEEVRIERKTTIIPLVGVVDISVKEVNNGIRKQYEDKCLICKDCGKKFLFTAKNQRYHEEQRWSRPKRCKNCRSLNNVRHLMHAWF